MPEFDPSVTYLPVAGFPGYLVGDDGSVWSCRKPRRGFQQGPQYGPWKRLTGRAPAQGYVYVQLFRGTGSPFTAKIHNLVLETFVGPRPLGHQCRHLSGDRFDNRLCNLAWGTPKENHADRIRHGRGTAGEAHGYAKLTNAGALEIRRLRAEGMLLREIAERFGLSISGVHHVVDGSGWKHI